MVVKTICNINIAVNFDFRIERNINREPNITFNSDYAHRNFLIIHRNQIMVLGKTLTECLYGNLKLRSD